MSFHFTCNFFNSYKHTKTTTIKQLLLSTITSCKRAMSLSVIYFIVISTAVSDPPLILIVTFLRIK